MLHLTMENGLPGNNVYDVYRDSRGFLWVCTDKGVARYNGLKFEIFTTFDGLPDNDVFFSQEDMLGRLWFGTYNGELCFYKNGIFHNASNTPWLKLPFKNSFIRYISNEKDSSITIAFFKENTFLNISGNKCTIYNIDDKLFVNVADVSKTSRGYHVICKDTTIDIDFNNKIIATGANKYNEPPRRQFIQNTKYLFNDSLIYDGGKIAGTLKKKFARHPINRFFFNDGHKFIATHTGLYIDDTLHILKNHRISAVTTDTAGNYLASTLDDGIYEFSKDFLNTRWYVGNYAGAVRYAHADDKKIYFTTAYNNLYSFEKGKIKLLYRHEGQAFRKNAVPTEPGYLIDENHRYYGIYDTDIVVISDLSKTRQISKYKTQFNGIKSIYEVDRAIYIRNASGIFKLGIPPNWPRKQTIFTAVSKNPYRERLFGMAKAANGDLWYSTVNSMYRIRHDTSSLQPQFKNLSLKYFDFAGHYLVGYTPDNRLLICDNINDRVKIDTVGNQNCIWDKFYKIDPLHVLISTNNLYRLLTLPSHEQDRFSISAIENSFLPLQAEAICTADDHCYFFKNGTITALPVKELLVNARPPQLFFQSLKTNNKSYAIGTEVSIPFNKSKNIKISFSVLAFTGKDVTCQYSVSKNGPDNWQDINGEITIVHPDYGSYLIKLRAKTISSIYSEPIAFTLTILKPFWATWWFITLCIAILMVIVGAALRLRISIVLRRREKQYDKEIRFIRSEYKALNALMNPHFIFNTLNDVQDLVNKNDKRAANEYIRIFADLIRQNMSNISKELITLQKEIDLINNYLLLEKLRFEDHLNYSIRIDPELDLSEIMVPPLLIQPLVENSIKHGIFPLQSADGFISITVSEIGGALRIEVKDNGPGISTKKKGTQLHESFGLENIRERLRQLSIIQKKEITLDITEVKGGQDQQRFTVATITIPIAEPVQG